MPKGTTRQNARFSRRKPYGRSEEVWLARSNNSFARHDVPYNFSDKAYNFSDKANNFSDKAPDFFHPDFPLLYP